MTFDFEFPSSGIPPWQSADHSFVGWVPTILGHLSFSMVGKKVRWTAHRCFNDLDSGTGERQVILHQRRISQDLPLWDFLVKQFKPNVVQDFILVSKTAVAQIPFVEGEKVRHLTDSQGVLHGFVYVVPKQDHIELEWDREEILRRVNRSIDPRCENASTVLIAVNSAILELKHKRILSHKLSFALFRTGELRVCIS